MPWGIVNSSFLLCGQPVQFIDTVYAVFLKVNVRQSPDNGSKYCCLIWWHLLNVCLFSLRKLSCFAGALGDSRMQTYSINPSCTGNRVMRNFHGINTNGLLKRQKTKPEITCLCKCSVTAISDLDLSLPPLRPHCEKPVDIILYPKLCIDPWFGLTFSKKIPEGLCNLFQVNDLTFGRNASRKQSGHFLGYPRLRVHMCYGTRRISSLEDGSGRVL